MSIQALTVPGCWSSQISKQPVPAAFTPRKYFWYSFLLDAELTGKIKSIKKLHWYQRELNPQLSSLKRRASANYATAWNRRENTLGLQLHLIDLQQYICMFIVIDMILGLHFFFCPKIIVIHLCVLSSLVIIFYNLSKLCLTYRPNKFFMWWRT